MNYQTNKDLAEAQYYLKMLDEFCKTGQVVIPEPSGSVCCRGYVCATWFCYPRGATAAAAVHGTGCDAAA